MIPNPPWPRGKFAFGKTKDFALLRSIALYLLAASAIALCMIWIDAPVAALFGGRFHFAIMETVLGGIALVGAELLLVAGLFLAARSSGRMGDVSRTLMLACAASMLAYGCNFLLKIVFGRPVPLTHHGAVGTFNFFQGDNHSSFPSGHMALLGALASIVWQSYPRTRLILIPLLCLAGAAIVAGNWHYVSDLIAGAVLGLTVGAAVGRLGQKQRPKDGPLTPSSATSQPWRIRRGR
jgi:membrane-associated phospholipid phosphatase